MSTRFATGSIFTLVGLVLPATTARAQDPSPAPSRVTNMLAGDRRVAGLFAERIQFFPGDRGRPHVHSGDLHVTGIQGRLFFNWGERFDTVGALALVAGDFLVIPAGRAHFEWVNEPAEVHVQGMGPVTTKYLDTLTTPDR
jgi:quercetin dioxygenase-like cupin family protein